MSRFIVGLTGGIGSGKTTVANEFANFGVELVDADVVAREVVEPGSDCLQQISQRFGEQILLADGQLDRSQLREIIFAEPAQKQWLNQLMHPAIRQLMLAQLQQAQSAYVLLIAPLLFENNLQRYTNTTLVVDINEQLQCQRTSQRDRVSQQQVQQIIASQLPRQQRLSQADFVLNNEQPWPEVQQQIALLHKKFMDFSQQSA